MAIGESLSFFLRRAETAWSSSCMLIIFLNILLPLNGMLRMHETGVIHGSINKVSSNSLVFLKCICYENAYQKRFQSSLGDCHPCLMWVPWTLFYCPRLSAAWLSFFLPQRWEQGCGTRVWTRRQQSRYQAFCFSSNQLNSVNIFPLEVS